MCRIRILYKLSHKYTIKQKPERFLPAFPIKPKTGEECFMPDVVIWELSCSSVRAPLASWGQWLSFANVPLHENWAKPARPGELGMRQSTIRKHPTRNSDRNLPKCFLHEKFNQVIRTAALQIRIKKLLCVLRKCDSLWFDLWFLFAYYNKRNKDKKGSRLLSSRPVSAIDTSRARRVGRWQEKRRRNVDIEQKRTQILPSSRIIPTNTWQQRNTAYTCYIFLTSYSHETFSPNAHLSHQSITCNSVHQSHTWHSVMTSTKVIL